MSSARILSVESLESRYLLAADVFQHPIEPHDVDNDRLVTPADTRAVLARLFVAAEEHAPPGFFDVNGDGSFDTQDLRDVFAFTILQQNPLPDVVLDELEARLLQIAENTDVLAEVLANWQVDQETLAELVDLVVAEADEHGVDLRQRLGEVLAEFDLTVGQLRDFVDRVVDEGLENGGDQLDAIRREFLEHRDELRDRLLPILQGQWDWSNLRDRADQLFTAVGLPDLTEDIVSFIDEAESGAVPLTQEAVDLINHLRDGIDDFDFQVVVEFDTAANRQGIVDLLTAFEDSGRDLPAEAVALRTALADGETLFGYLFGAGLPGLLDGLL